MKYLLTATLIATALASPVSALETTLNCRLLGTSSEDMNFSLAVDTATWIATWRHNTNLVEEAQVIAYDEKYVIWAVVNGFPHVGAWILHLNRENLRLQLSTVSDLDFGWADDGMSKSQFAYQCSSGI
jgi:hypothetical protein